MRLKKIKVSGFKSFVDSMTVPVDRNLVGIVGPNGCGKSNVIDAVRWVMGESSAKHLRGDAMTDVIFNGSSGRKPVGQASVELIFDNTHNPLVGQYASYNEIAIKRVINRDAQSTYYLNNSKCRRKDLAEIFLGTGLGPRSYSIIEQGMISRVIEAKPEDLRAYFEEAAGISKYKEKRRETENRIKHTRENLERIHDISTELAKQLDKLSDQAKTAEQYKILKTDLTKNEKLELGLLHNKFSDQYKIITDEVNTYNVNLEELNSIMQAHSTELEQNKIAYNQLQQKQQSEQAKFYQIETIINNNEQEIKRLESEQLFNQKNISNLEQQKNNCQNNIESKKSSLTEVSEELAEITPQYEAIIQDKKNKQQELKTCEEKFATWEKSWAHHSDLIHSNSKIISQNQAVIEKHDTLMVRSQKRIDALKEEQNELKKESHHDAIKSLKLKYEQHLEQQDVNQEKLDEIIEHSSTIEQNITNLEDDLNILNHEYQSAKGKLTSLNTLQEHALGKDSKKLNEWLKQHDLEDAKRLGEIIDVEQGWEIALEAILRDYIKAVVLSDTDISLSNKIDSFTDEDLKAISNFNLAFVNYNKNINYTNNLDDTNLLINKIKAPKSILGLFNNIYCADDYAAAKNLLDKLDDSCTVVTKDGAWLNKNWFTRYNSNNNQDSTNFNSDTNSIVARSNKISELTLQIEELEHKIEDLKEIISQNREELAQNKQSRHNIELEIREIIKQQSDLKSNLSKLESKAEQQQSRIYRIDQELAETIKHVEIDSSAVKNERAKLEKAMLEMEEYNSVKYELEEQGLTLRKDLKNFRTEFDRLKESEHKLELNNQKLKQQAKHLEEDLVRLNKQYENLCQEITISTENIENFKEPIEELKIKLSENIELKQKQSELLALANEDYNKAQEEITTIEKNINAVRKEHDNMRNRIESARIKQNEINTRLSTIIENIEDKNLNVEDLVQYLPENISLSEVKNKVRDLKSKIEALGPVNLTAIEEYEVEFKRKEFLDTQQADLEEALNALEEAIAQIDQETKARFRETYDFVNEQFQYLFPKVFGGGRASLSLTSEDLLESGVTVMAQPPGKRNASIHLLSGGEKALTAIALVFSIFRLNPAPFCMLDEVDAPLDDANVTRYCNLVKEMSKDVQFIFITHNKVTMTMAEHMIGVTMHEPGISRLVAVDIEEAAKLAEA